MSDIDEDWARVMTLARESGAGDVDPAAWGDVLRRVGPLAGIPREDCEAALASPTKTGNLVRELQRRGRESMDRLNEAVSRAGRLERLGHREEARRIYRSFLATTSLPFHRGIAEHQLERLASGSVVMEHVFTYTPAVGGEPIPIAVRIGEPVRDGDAWVSVVEVSNFTHDDAVHIRGADWMQALAFAAEFAAKHCSMLGASGTLDPPIHPRDA